MSTVWKVICSLLFQLISVISIGRTHELKLFCTNSSFPLELEKDGILPFLSWNEQCDFRVVCKESKDLIENHHRMSISKLNEWRKLFRITSNIKTLKPHQILMNQTTTIEINETISSLAKLSKITDDQNDIEMIKLLLCKMMTPIIDPFRDTQLSEYGLIYVINQLIDILEIKDVSTHSMISEFYLSTLNEFYSQNVSQKQLVLLIEKMIRQNIKLGINLNIALWDRFFSLYYKLDNEYRDNYICQLLGKMQSEGSNIYPNLNIFNTILFGIATNPYIQNPIKLTSFIINDVMRLHHITANRRSYRSLFRVFVNQRDVESAKHLLILRPFIFDYGNVDIFNHILDDLLNHNAGNYGKVLLFIVNQVMRHYKVKPNIKTYEILDKFYEKTKQNKE